MKMKQKSEAEKEKARLAHNRKIHEKLVAIGKKQVEAVTKIEKEANTRADAYSRKKRKIIDKYNDQIFALADKFKGAR